MLARLASLVVLTVRTICLAGCGGATPPPPITLSVQPTRTPEAKKPTPNVNPRSIKAVPISALGINSLPGSGGPVHIVAISCWSQGNCVAGGNYDDNNNFFYYQTPFVATERRAAGMHRVLYRVFPRFRTTMVTESKQQSPGFIASLVATVPLAVSTRRLPYWTISWSWLMKFEEPGARR